MKTPELPHPSPVRTRALLLIASVLASSHGCGGAQRSGATTDTRASEQAPVGTATSAIGRLASGAVLFDDLGPHHREVTTSSGEAQAYFDQGLRLAYGFNHDEAARSFARAAQLDPECALCFWGVTYTLGPNYNMPLLHDRAEAAFLSIAHARSITNVSPVERALIEAMALRHSGPEYLDPARMQPHIEAYAEAMHRVAEEFPDDLDVQVLTAEAMMNVRPWQLYTNAGEPSPDTPEILRLLESVIERDPQHPGANRFYIHAVEASREPGRALPSAERLPSLMPGAGHMVHMPAHIFQRIGRYADASNANREAIEVDRRYLSRVTPPGYYPFYVGHNYGFLAYSASMEGRRQESLEAARMSAEQLPRDMVCGMPGMDFFLSLPLLVMVRFGMWDELLAEPAPDARYPVLTALYHHARGMALASRNEHERAREAQRAIETIHANMSEETVAGLNSARTVLALAAKILEARIAERTGDGDSIELYREAVALEDSLAYNEPADWFYSTRPYLGAVLLDAHQAREAEAVYRADLEQLPNNGWSLFGLYRALRAQRRTRDAADVESQFRRAWARTDIELERSAF